MALYISYVVPDLERKSILKSLFVAVFLSEYAKMTVPVSWHELFKEGEV